MCKYNIKYNVFEMTKRPNVCMLMGFGLSDGSSSEILCKSLKSKSYICIWRKARKHVYVTLSEGVVYTGIFFYLRHW